MILKGKHATATQPTFASMKYKVIEAIEGKAYLVSVAQMNEK